MKAEREALRQQALLRALWRDGSAETLAGWVGDGPHMQRGLQAYQAHAGALAERALAAAYPSVQQLLGEASFAALARAFWHHRPPVVGDVACWGESLAAFVAAAQGLAEEPYLADLARLEWAVHTAATAADTTPTAFGLQRLAEADALLLRLVPQAGTALVDSTHPIVSIWQAHRQPAAVDEPLDERFAPVREAFAQQRAEPALVWRQGWRVQVAAVNATEAFFTRRVLNGEALGAALQASASPNQYTTENTTENTTETAFEFQPWLLLQLQRGWLAGVSPAVEQR